MKRPLISVIFSVLCALYALAANLGGQRVAILGDSMTWIGGDSCLNDRGWTKWFVEEARPLGVDIYARSGATWTNTPSTRGDIDEYTEVLSDENVIYTQALRLIDRVNRDSLSKPDVIIIYAGANDAWFSAKRPDIFNPDIRKAGFASECLSLYSSVIFTGSLLRERFPASRIILLTPVEMTKVPVADVTRVGDIIERAGKELGFEALRTDHDVDIRRNEEMKQFRHTSDGVHTNSDGAKLIGRYVALKLMN